MGESTTDMVFAGHDLIAENGVILAESRKFTTGLTISEIDVQRLSFERRRFTTFPSSAGEGYLQVPFSLDIHPTQLTRPVSSRPFIPANETDRESCCEDILSIQAHGLLKRLGRIPARRQLS